MQTLHFSVAPVKGLTACRALIGSITIASLMFLPLSARAFEGAATCANNGSDPIEQWQEDGGCGSCQAGPFPGRDVVGICFPCG
jgi:hypothetical protein